MAEQAAQHPAIHGIGSGYQRVLLAIVLLGVGIALPALPLPAAIVLVLVIAALALGSVRPTYLIALVFVAIPAELLVLDVGWVSLSPVQIVVMLAVVLMVAEMLLRGRITVPSTPLDTWIFLLLATGFIGAIGAIDPEATLKKAGLNVFFAAFYYLVVSKVRTTKDISTLLKALALSCAAVGGYGVWVSYRYLAHGASGGTAIIVGSEGLTVPRAGSTLGTPTVLASLLVIALPIAIALIFETRGFWRPLAVALSGILVVSLGFTFTRGAWIGAVAGLCVLGLDKRMRSLLVVLAILVVALSPQVVYERMLSSTNTGRAEISHRFDYWRGALLVAERNPVFGAGIDNYRHAYSRLPVPETALRWTSHPHNIALHLLADNGLVGLLAFMGLTVTALMMVLRKGRSDPDLTRRTWRVAIAAAFVGTLMHQTTDSLLLQPTWNAIFWTLLAVSVVLGARHGEGDTPLGEIAK